MKYANMAKFCHKETKTSLKLSQIKTNAMIFAKEKIFQCQIQTCDPEFKQLVALPL